MRNKLKILVQCLIGVLNGNVSKESIQSISIFVSVLCAIYSMKRNPNIPINTLSKNKAIYIKNRFPILYEDFLSVKQSLSKFEFNEIYRCVLDVYSVAETDDNIISWIYQYLKKDLEKQAFRNTGKQNYKIEGNDILYTTQFFTDEYMVRYLIDNVFNIKNEQITNTLFVDPAAGGGNFLTYTFNKLYDWYTKNTNQTPSNIVKSILSKNLLGYDLDSHLAKIASLSLYVIACKKALPNFNTNIPIYGGIEDDILGYLADEVKSNCIGKKDFNNVINTARNDKMDIVFVTNPPFMGKRDMDMLLKSYLLNKYPICKGDLCVSFLFKLMQNLKDNDIVAIVSQNGWLNLSSLKLFRKELLINYHILECVDLGSNAFIDINGEKTNVVLCIIGKKSGSLWTQDSAFINLKPESYQTKVSTLKKKLIKKIVIDSSLFLSNPSYEICYQLENNFTSLKTLPAYSGFAKCMQGTSTGNNKEFVKYIWEKVSNPEDWELVSKGGGYSKWHGLNYFKVKWGKDASLIKNSPGSALRNIELIDKTELVYSDTGTLGLNVRLLEPGQVFIASGPGIIILQGNPICHMAFLNSRIATFLLKVRNPKFTVSAGYISSLPVVESLFSSLKIENNARICIECKKQYLSKKLPNLEFTHDDYTQIINIDDYIIKCIKNDVVNNFKRYEAEALIDKEIVAAYNFTKEELNEIYNITGGFGVIRNKVSNVTLEQIDEALCSTINENCMTISKKINGFAVGSENLIEVVGYNLGLSPKELYDIILRNISKLKMFQNKYKTDLLHKVILRIVSLENLRLHSKRLELDSIVNIININYPVIYKEFDISKRLIREIIEKHHSKSFFGKPIFRVENEVIITE